MHVRLTYFGFKPEKLQELKKFYNETAIPTLKQQKGNVECRLLEPIDKKDDYISMTTWRSKKIKIIILPYVFISITNHTTGPGHIKQIPRTVNINRIPCMVDSKSSVTICSPIAINDLSLYSSMIA